jgi:hypothetical protein
MKSSDLFKFNVFEPLGLTISGDHSSDPAPLRADMLEAFQVFHARWKQKVFSKPGGFDGDRAVLQEFQQTGRHIHVRTAYRTYSEGRALHDTWVAAQEQTPAPVQPAGPQPDAGLSWGFSLASLVLLPYNHVLCAQRSLNLLVNPGAWAVVQTEVIEPGDISSPDMQSLLERLTSEEMPSLVGHGTHRYVGLGTRETSYTWHLVGLLDLREASVGLMDALGKLQPDAETAAWSAIPLSEEAALDTHKFPANLVKGPAQPAKDLELARFLSLHV